MARKWTIKHEWKECECGCGEWFTAAYKTRPRKYIDNAHKQKAYNNRKRKRRSQSSIAVKPPAFSFVPGNFAFGSGGGTF